MNGSSNSPYPDVSLIAVTAASVAVSLFTASYYCSGLVHPPRRKLRSRSHPVSKNSPADELDQNPGTEDSSQPDAPSTPNPQSQLPHSQILPPQHTDSQLLVPHSPSLSNTTLTSPQTGENSPSRTSSDKRPNFESGTSNLPNDLNENSKHVRSHQQPSSSDVTVQVEGKPSGFHNGLPETSTKAGTLSPQLHLCLQKNQSECPTAGSAASSESEQGDSDVGTCTVSRLNLEPSPLPPLVNASKKPASIDPLATPGFSWVVFWDFENVGIPHGTPVPKFVHAIRVFLSTHRNNSVPDPVVRIVAIGDLNKLSECAQAQLFCSGVMVQHTAPLNVRKDFSDKAILTEMCLLTLQHPPPCGIALLSGDVDFSYCISRLTALSYYTLIIAGGEKYSSSLATAPSAFSTLPEVLQRTTVPVRADDAIDTPRKNPVASSTGRGRKHSRHIGRGQRFKPGRHKKNTERNTSTSRLDNLSASPSANAVKTAVSSCPTSENCDFSCTLSETPILKDGSARKCTWNSQGPLECRNTSTELNTEIPASSVEGPLGAKSQSGPVKDIQLAAASSSNETGAALESCIANGVGGSSSTAKRPVTHSDRHKMRDINAQRNARFGSRKISKNAVSSTSAHDVANPKLNTGGPHCGQKIAYKPENDFRSDESKAQEVASRQMSSFPKPSHLPVASVHTKQSRASLRSAPESGSVRVCSCQNSCNDFRDAEVGASDASNSVGRAIKDLGTNVESQAAKITYNRPIRWVPRKRYSTTMVALTCFLIIVLVLYCIPVRPLCRIFTSVVGQVGERLEKYFGLEKRESLSSRGTVC